MRNPFLISLLAAAGFVFVLAFMLWVVIVQVTDDLLYDRVEVTVLWGWTIALSIAGTAAVVGAVAIAGVRWELRRAAPAPEPRAVADRLG
ncbi:hypothetical protein [Microbacterium sp. NPDC058389]|uniref:hypothetical protein n=1 Tax=Microbacterium sp. NPDC058389 TaxID=3346475 RepID=UPI00364FC31E